jgi:RNA polymerase sigma factor (sigma-70 family)
MLSPITTSFLGRLRANDQAAWYELWETFGPVVQAQLTKWGRGQVGHETVRDLSQETLASLADSIDRFDPSRGVRFSTWLLSIAKHVLGDELDRRRALKRGGNSKAASLDESWMVADGELPVDVQYEAAVFRAKVEAAIRVVSTKADFQDFAVYRMRVFEGQSGKEVAAALGVSEPTISRRCGRVRDMLRATLTQVVATYSFTHEETQEPTRNGLVKDPKNEARTDHSPQEDEAFDLALAEIYHRQAEVRKAQSRQGTPD